MENSTKVSLAAAVAAGYVLGRTKKGKLAIGLASLVAGQQLPLNPRELVSMGARKLAANPQVAPLIEQARGDVLDAGRTALSATANRRLEAVADALQERTNALLEPPPDEDEDEDHDEEEDEDEPEDEEPEEEEEEEEEEEPPRRRPTKRSAGAAKKTPSKKAPAKKAPAKKTAAKKTAPKRTAAKKPAKKTAEKKPSTKGAAAKESSNRNSRRR
ncbi:histone protein [Streptomyces sp. NBC_01500]|uniref:histone protein n=1 Tax=Streptomyces sp. NBC_01500 TaxID=2903886 RepID=UPI0022585EDE|nr:histone protein [Streptomyces sp. NBC_01500]MCX4550815.1 histone protein [Streptomyces sp. NBC_01500]